MSTNFKQNKVVLQHRSNRAWYATCLLLLSTIVALGGPWACVVHCMIMDLDHHGHHHHEQHGAVVSGFLDDCPTILSGDDQQLREPPTALTIAIMMSLTLAPLLFGGRLQLRAFAASRLSPAHPPPRDPPRLPICFA